MNKGNQKAAVDLRAIYHTRTSAGGAFTVTEIQVIREVSPGWVIAENFSVRMPSLLTVLSYKHRRN